ncbi:MAG: c-type cytochrome [Lentisphaeraceae bacterium]|nr:c-type cytochrome [Lentisphaeraceae bacterium]
MQKFKLVCVLLIFSLSWSLLATTPVILFDGKSANSVKLKGWELKAGVLSGEGFLESKKPLSSNFEMHLRFKFIEKFGKISFDKKNVIPFGFNKNRTPKKQAANMAGKWYSVKILVRAMPEEKEMYLNLTPLSKAVPAIAYYGTGPRLADKYNSSEYKYEMDDAGFVTGISRKFKLKFDGQVEISHLSLHPLSPTSPRNDLLLEKNDLNETVLKGEHVYKTNCMPCHGDGMGKAPNPLARSFATEPMANGTDPYSIWKTLTVGFRNMPPMASLSSEQRFQVIHYMREKILKPHNPKSYFDVNEEYLAKFSQPLYSRQEILDRKNKSPEMRAMETGRYRDHGPVMVSANKGKRNAMQVKLDGDMTISYNLHNMSSLGVWQGSFMAMMGSHYYSGRGNTQPTSNGKEIADLSQWRWAHADKINHGVTEDYGPMTTAGFEHKGHYVNGAKAVLHYQFENREILETPEVVVEDGTHSLIQHVQVGPGDKSVMVAIATPAPTLSISPGEGIAQIGQLAIAIKGDVKPLQWKNVEDSFTVIIPASTRPIKFSLIRGTGKTSAAQVQKLLGSTEIVDFEKMKNGGARLWSKTYTMSGDVADDSDAYVVDTLPVPYKNDYNAWMRTTSLAFFPDGRAAVTTYSGDVWIVSGIDRDLNEVTWSRFAAGLHEGFGCQIVDGQIYVGTRNGIVRLHDLNGDGEADYYEQFFRDPDFGYRYHGYNFDLVRDSKGYFYYSKNGQLTDIKGDGGCMKISPDGKSSELFATGFRSPNGMGKLPGDRLLFSDNQGGWVPAGKISIIEQGKWYGGAIPKEGDQPKTYAKPFIWLPQEVDNSCGGQEWISDKRFGPYGAGSLFHTSFGKGKAMMVFMDEVGGITQGAVWSFPNQFDSGIMRARTNPNDGQVYVTGTRGWGTKAEKDGCLQRVRYTGIEASVLTNVKARTGRIELSFSNPLPEGTLDKEQFSAEQWNYLWSSTYGSKKYSLRNPKVETPDSIKVSNVSLSQDRRVLTVEIPELSVSDQVRLVYQVPGKAVAEEVHLTIHALK